MFNTFSSQKLLIVKFYIVQNPTDSFTIFWASKSVALSHKSSRSPSIKGLKMGMAGREAPIDGFWGSLTVKCLVGYISTCDLLSVILDASPSCHVAAFAIGSTSTTSRVWDIKVTQYKCGDTNGGKGMAHAVKRISWKPGIVSSSPCSFRTTLNGATGCSRCRV